MNRILMLCQFFYPDKVSSSVLPFELAEDLVKQGDLVTVVCGVPREDDVKIGIEKKEIFHGIKIKRCSYIQFNKNKFIGRILNYFSFILSVLLKLKDFFKKDVCIVYSNPPLLALLPATFKKICNFKIIYVVYDVYPDVAIKFNVINENSTLAKIFNRINDYVFKQCDKIVVLSKEMKDYFLQNKKVKEDQLEIIPNWYNLKNDYIPYNTCEDKITLLYGGNMGVCQEMNTLLDVAEKLKDNDSIHFIFSGNGNKSDYIKNYINEKKLNNCTFYDFLPKDEYERLMMNADIFVVSLEKVAKGLGSPSKVYCYYAMGRPVLAIMPEDTDIVRDLNRFDSGYTFKNGEVDKIVMWLSNINNKDELKLKGRNARSMYLNYYTKTINTKKYKKLMEEIVI